MHAVVERQASKTAKQWKRADRSITWPSEVSYLDVPDVPVSLSSV
jgi:hypothetical protein